MSADQGLFVPLILGFIEGLTEFLPVSSTGHMLLAERFFGLAEPDAFFVMIQFGAILAVVTVYFKKLGELIVDALKGQKEAWMFALNVVLASIPAGLVGFLGHDYIQGVLYESPLLICWMLLIGGIILLFIDRLPLKPRYTDIYTYPWHLSLMIGLFQMLALVPGVSRSGATIVGSLLFGTDKRSATEFTFFIALPIMLGAFLYDFYKHAELILHGGAGFHIAIGFGVALLVAIAVVRYLLDFVKSYGLAFFGWWRIIVGGAGLIALYFMV